MNLLRLIELFKKVRERSLEANTVLETHLAKTDPCLFPTYHNWAAINRNINCSSATSVLSEQISELEGEEFTKLKRDISFFAGAAARISDDLMDSGRTKPQAVYLLDRSTEPVLIPEQRLFCVFNDRLEELVAPFDFKNRFRDLIRKYNCAQEKGLLLSGQIPDEELISIKNQTGGYSLLLLYGLMSPNQNDPTVGSNFCYDSLSDSLPKTKAEALFNYGALASRMDDLYDQKLDRVANIKNLATSKITSWKTINREIDYVERGLREFYSDERLQKMMPILKAQISRTAAILNNLLK